MIISREDAARALAESEAASTRVHKLQGYRHFSVHAMIWGAVWMAANGLADWMPNRGNVIWAVLVVVGVTASMIAGSRNRALDTHSAATDAGATWRWLGSMVTVALFFVAAFAIMPPTTGAQSGAFISMFFAAAYIVLGIWSGWKIMLVGLFMAALILAGYFSGLPHLQLWCGVIAGGAMLLGGWWMRRA